MSLQAHSDVEVPGTRFDADTLADLELAQFPHWVCWRFEMRDGEPTKPPVSAHTGRYASSTDPATWAPFDVAVRRARAEGWGIGFCFHTTLNPFSGVDLDGCRCIETATIDPWAQSIIAACDSYG